MSDEVTLVQLRLNCSYCGHELEAACEELHEASPPNAPQYRTFRIRDVITDYLLGKEECCPNSSCRKKLDWWRIVRQTVRTQEDSSVGLLLTGAQVTVVKFTLIPETPYHLYFRDCGIPLQSTVVSVRYRYELTAPMLRPLLPLENFFAAGGRPIRKELPSSGIFLEPVPLRHEAFANEALRLRSGSRSLLGYHQNLRRASPLSLPWLFMPCLRRDYARFHFQAQVAVESLLRDVLECILKASGVGADHVRDLLIKALTFNQQLNALLPAFSHLLQMPPLPAEIRGCVNRLATARNRIAHGGGEPELSFADVADGLVASLFAFRQMLYVQSHFASTGKAE